MAGIPLCCQHLTWPWTRREQGVPFFVRAPQIKTSSSTVSGAIVPKVFVSPGELEAELTDAR
jgi:hypothetical protein